MKIALDWIADYLQKPIGRAADPQAAEQALINAGLPLESNEPFAATHVLDVEVTSNRSDCLCHIGLARELAALLGDTFRMPAVGLTPQQQKGPAVQTLASVTVEDAVGSPYYSARVIQGVKIGPSPAWMVQRLESIGLRSVNNVVDVTNYVMMELGQPLHTFDYDLLEGRRIIVRRARPGEKIVAIDGRTYALDSSMLVIADARRPVAVAGVMGGKETEVTDRTVNLLLESARFDPLTIRSQARALSLMSDSSYRFERGIDPAAAERASLRAAQLIVELAGGSVAPGVVAVGSADRPPLRVDLRLRRIAEVLGVPVPAEQAIAILAALEFAPEKTADAGVIRCTVPTHRLDVEREIDLIEEVARVYGYRHITPHDRVSHPVQPELFREKASRVIRQAMQAASFNEALTITLVPEAEARRFVRSSGDSVIAPAHGGWKGDVLRPSLLPSLLQVRRTNQNAGIPDARLYEHAQTFCQEGDPLRQPPVQHRMLALVGNSVAEVKGALEAVLFRLNAQASLVTRPCDLPWFEPGVSAELLLKHAGREKPLGTLGQFSAAVQAAYDLRQTPGGAEVSWDLLVACFEPVRRAKALPRFPGVRRDLSVVLEDAVRWSEIEQVLREAHLPFLEQVDFVGTFRSKQLGAGKKSLTLTLEFRDPSATLRSEQVDAQMKTALERLGQRFGATLRA